LLVHQATGGAEGGGGRLRHVHGVEVHPLRRVEGDLRAGAAPRPPAVKLGDLAVAVDVEGEVLVVGEAGAVDEHHPDRVAERAPAHELAFLARGADFFPAFDASSRSACTLASVHACRRAHTRAASTTAANTTGCQRS